jgi:hypothetical protein
MHEREPARVDLRDKDARRGLELEQVAAVPPVLGELSA